MPVTPPEIDPSRLESRLAALPGIERLREAAGAESLYVVGGTVRDLLLGAERGDLDLVVEGDAPAMARRLGAEVRVYERFGTATVRADGLTLDLASARAESYPAPGALPEVRPGTLAEDLARRDFTINAMAVPLAGPAELIDPHGGAGDLAAGDLRVLHERSFADDPTRALRAARYAARLELSLEPGTAELLRAADLNTVSPERVEAELRRLAGEPRAADGFALAAAWGLLDLDEGALELIRAVDRLTSTKPWSAIAARPDAIVAAARGDLGPARELASRSPARPSEVVAAARGRSGVELALARALGAEWLDAYAGELREVRLEIGGADLLAAGIEEGPAVGRGLAAALRAKLDGLTSGPADELRIALDAAARTG